MLFLISCGKEEKEVPIYCCDPEINDWVITNQSYLNTLSRSELVVYGPEKVKAAFISFSPEKKAELWKEKVNELLKYNWTENEYQHIKRLQNFISPEIYNQSNSEQAKVFSEEWMTFASETLNWDFPKIVETIGFLEMPQELQKSLKDQIESRFKTPNCQCEWDTWCYIASTGQSYECGANSAERPCKPTQYRCGFLYIFSCNGRCIID